MIEFVDKLINSGLGSFLFAVSFLIGFIVGVYFKYRMFATREYVINTTYNRESIQNYIESKIIYLKKQVEDDYRGYSYSKEQSDLKIKNAIQELVTEKTFDTKFESLSNEIKTHGQYTKEKLGDLSSSINKIQSMLNDVFLMEKKALMHSKK